MQTRLTTALAVPLAVLAVLGLATVPAAAATHDKAAAAAKGSTSSADNSADQLNATSLNDAKTGTSYTPANAGTTAPETKPMTQGRKSMHDKAHSMPASGEKS